MRTQKTSDRTELSVRIVMVQIRKEDMIMAHIIITAIIFVIWINVI
jgi:hypothetical protein